MRAIVLSENGRCRVDVVSMTVGGQSVEERNSLCRGLFQPHPAPQLPRTRYDIAHTSLPSRLDPDTHLPYTSSSSVPTLYILIRTT